MITFRKGFQYTIIWTSNTREIQNEHPYGRIILLDQDDGYYLIAVEERRKTI